MWRSKRFREEAFGRFRIVPWAQEKFLSISLRIHSTIEFHPYLFYFDIHLIDAPRVVRRFEMGPTALLQFWRVVLHPTVDRRVIDM